MSATSVWKSRELLRGSVSNSLVGTQERYQIFSRPCRGPEVLPTPGTPRARPRCLSLRDG